MGGAPLGNVNGSIWKPEHNNALRSLVEGGDLSFAGIAAALNELFGTSYTRNAAIGRAGRMGLCQPQQIGRSAWAIENARQRDRLKKRKRAKSYVPSDVAGRAERKKQNLALFQATGTSPTSPAYRKHLPYLPEMTKTELRAMLATAAANTALMTGASE